MKDKKCESDQDRSHQETTDKYAADIESLAERYGDLENLDLSISLHDALEICPRARRRVEAYQGLRSYLRKAYNCRLDINSKRMVI